MEEWLKMEELQGSSESSFSSLQRRLLEKWDTVSDLFKPFQYRDITNSN